MRKGKLCGVCLGAFFCSIMFLFASCENFLKGADIKEKLEREIYIANHESPVVTIEEPAFSDSGVARNKAIIISFSMQMDPQTFAGSYDIVDSSDNSLLANFMEPKWANENTLVTILSNEKNPVDLHGKKTMDIYFKLSKNCTTPNGLPIKEAINYKYRINETEDPTPPTIDPKSYIERPQIIYKGNLISDSVTLTEGAVTPENEAQLCTTNHINSQFTAYVEGSDLAGDIKGHVVVRRIKDVSGNNVQESAKDFIFDLAKLNGSDNCGGAKTIDLSSSYDYTDGLYEVKVFARDSAGTDSEECKVYYLVRDTAFEFLVSSRNIYEMPFFRTDMTEGFTTIPNWVPNPDYDPNYTYPAEVTTDEQKAAYKQFHEFYRYDLEYEMSMPEHEPSAAELATDPFMHHRWYYGPDSVESFITYKYCDFNKQPATVEKLQFFKQRLYFESISNDVFYKSYLEYAENYTYFISWGFDLEHLCNPVRITSHKEFDADKVQFPGSFDYYNLPQEFISDINTYSDQDIIYCIDMFDSVGNKRSMYGLNPKSPVFYSYKVSEGENGKRDVILNFNESIRTEVSAYTPIPDKNITSIYRIYYKKAGETELTRNTAVPFEHDYNEQQSDSNLLKGLEAGCQYDVYIEQRYDMSSNTNSQWCGCTYSPLCHISIDTTNLGQSSAGGANAITKPVIEGDLSKTKQSAGPNTGRFYITVEIPDDVYAANKAYEEATGRKVSYIPCFRPKKVFNWERVLEDGSWTYYDPHDVQVGQDGKKTITFEVKNPLRAPMGLGDAWAKPKQNPGDPKKVEECWETLWWDGFVAAGKVRGDYTYLQAAKVCTEKYGYDAVESFVKIIATDGISSVESDTVEVYFYEEDDNIPPIISNDVSLHDGRLSYDGHAFEFQSLVTENEGHLADTFNYYYTPYNPAWGDSLPEATSAIESLPGGVATYNGTTWFDNRQGAMYEAPMVIPIYGLADGQYMFFAKVYDTKGNYAYVTLGKANIATFKNKLQVEYRILDDDILNDQAGMTARENMTDEQENEFFESMGRHFFSTLKLEGYEQNFDRNMINLQEFSNYTDQYSGEQVKGWKNYYGDINALQECVFESAKSSLWNYNPDQLKDAYTGNDKDVVFLETWDDANQVSIDKIVYGQDAEGNDIYGYQLADKPRTLYRWGWYRLTVQSFNENYIITGENGRSGVDRIYGRPYHYLYKKDKKEYEEWASDILYYVDGETKYDVCTEETVSNTVYFYTPGIWVDADGRYCKEDLSDFKASFFSSNARATSNHSHLVNVLASSRDLGSDPDEWERRGKLIATHVYNQNYTRPNKEDYKIEDINHKMPWDAGYIDTYDLDRYNRDLDDYKNVFDWTVAQQDMASANEKGHVYYVAVVHFADGSTAVSDTYTMYGF